MKVGFVGVGEMGNPMVRRVLAAGHDVRFYARRPEVRAATQALGAVACDSLDEVGAGCDLVVICVFSDPQVHDVCFGDAGVLAGMTPGSVLLNHTTGSPTTALALRDAAARVGVRFLDAALSGPPSAIEAGRLTLLIGGDPAVLDDVRSALASYSDPIICVGDVGDGQRTKLVNNAAFAANIVLAGEVERIARDLGLDPVSTLNAISRCSGDSFSLRTVAAMGSAATAWERAGVFIRKDVAMVKAVAAELDIDLGLLGDVAGRDPTTPVVKGHFR